MVASAKLLAPAVYFTRRTRQGRSRVSGSCARAVALGSTTIWSALSAERMKARKGPLAFFFKLHAPRAVRVEQAEGVVAAVVDGDLAGRNRRGLRQRDVKLAALVRRRRRVALVAGREHQPEDEQHHQQGVEQPPALHP